MHPNMAHNHLPVFVLMGSQDYYYLIEQNIAQLHRIYPHAEVLVYSWGPSPFVSEKTSKVTVVDWTEKVEDTSHLLSIYTPENIRYLSIAYNQRTPRGLMQRLRKAFIKRYPNSCVSKSIADRALRYENMLIQKVLCLQDASTRLRNRAFLFLDADAFVFDTLSELFTHEHHVVLTIVDPEKIRWGHNACNVINVGVMFFNSFQKARDAFLREWCCATMKGNEFCKEQTALVRLLQKKTTTLFKAGAEEIVSFDQTPVKIWVVPASQYNRHELYDVASWPEEAIPRAKIYHFTNMTQDHQRMQASLERVRQRFKYSGT